MDGRLVWRARYRVGQFAEAIRASLVPLSTGEQAEVRACLPESAWSLFDRMPRADQLHSLKVLRTLRGAGHDHPALLQAALLHDCAKREGGVRLWHRVAVVLLRARWPSSLDRWVAGPAPVRASWRYPLWAHLNHPALGAEMAAGAGCDPVAVDLIRQHGDRVPRALGDPSMDRLLAALQAADDDN